MTHGANPVHCGACRHYDPNHDDLRDGDEVDDPDMGHLGTCTALDNVALPRAWRYATREVVGVWSLEKIQCPAFQGTATA